LQSVELCAGAGGQALGLSAAGFSHLALVENDKYACQTLRQRSDWAPVVYESDLHDFYAVISHLSHLHGCDLVAAGVPCPPFSHAGAQLGKDDSRNLFPIAIKIIDAIKPKAVLFENVRGFLDSSFDEYRCEIEASLPSYILRWKLLNACDFGVPQLRPRVVGIGLMSEFAEYFEWPDERDFRRPPTVGEALYDDMRVNGWQGADQWRLAANKIAPTLVGGSKKHGGADLGPTRAKKAWAALDTDGYLLADRPPDRDFVGRPRLTVEMAAKIQGFPPEWKFSGGKTAAYRQVGNAFPMPVAMAVGHCLYRALTKSSKLPIHLGRLVAV